MQYWGFSRPSEACVSPPGGDFFHGVFLFGTGCNFPGSFSVLQRHGVSPPGGDFFHGVFLFGDRM